MKKIAVAIMAGLTAVSIVTLITLVVCGRVTTSQKFTNCQIQIFEKPLSDMDPSESYYEQSTYFIILLAERAEIDLEKQLLNVENCEYSIPDDRGFHNFSWSYGSMFMSGDLKIDLEKKTQSPGTIFIDADKTYVYSYNKETEKFEFVRFFKKGKVKE